MHRYSLTKVLFVLPCVFAFTMVILIPFFFGLYFSMTDWNGVSDSIKFLGFVHFGRVLVQPGFIYAFLISMAYTAINVVLVNALGFVLALVVTGNLRSVAIRKLRGAGLLGQLRVDVGGYGSDGNMRAELVALALRRATDVGVVVDPARVWVIGDT